MTSAVNVTQPVETRCIQADIFCSIYHTPLRRVWITGSCVQRFSPYRFVPPKLNVLWMQAENVFILERADQMIQDLHEFDELAMIDERGRILRGMGHGSH